MLKKLMIIGIGVLLSGSASAMWFFRTPDQVFKDASERWGKIETSINKEYKEARLDYLVDIKDVAAKKWNDAQENGDSGEMERLNAKLITITQEIEDIKTGKVKVGFVMGR